MGKIACRTPLQPTQVVAPVLNTTAGYYKFEEGGRNVDLIQCIVQGNSTSFHAYVKINSGDGVTDSDPATATDYDYICEDRLAFDLCNMGGGNCPNLVKYVSIFIAAGGITIRDDFSMTGIVAGGETLN